MSFRRVSSLLALLSVSSLFVACGGEYAAPTARAGQATVQPSPTTPATPRPTEIVNPDGSRVLIAPQGFDPPRTSDDQTLVLAGSTTGPTTLDPALLRDAESAFIARQIFRGLVRLDNELAPQPDLAERIEISADGLTYTFNLRADATFQNGTPLDANAVAASFNRACDPALGGGDGSTLPAAIYLGDIAGAKDRLSGSAATISGITVSDSETLEITLERPVANFLYKLAGPPGWLVDITSATTDGWWHDPNGSGPFRLERWSGSGTMVLDGWNDFWGGSPALKEVRILGGSDALQPLNLYESNDIDVTGVPFYAIDRVLDPGNALNQELTVVPELSTAFIVLNPNQPPFDDPTVRRAFAMTFDRSKVARVMFDGKVREASGLVPPGVLQIDWPANPIAYDPTAARELLSGDPLGTRRPRMFEPGAGISMAMKSVVERDLGIEFDAIDVDWEVFSGLLTDRSMPAFVLSWIADYPDPANFLTTLFSSTSPDNYTGYSNPEVDRLLDEAEVEADQAKRADLYLEAQQLIIDDAVLIPLYHDVGYTLVKPWVKGLPISPIGILSLEDVWIDGSGD